ncbi:cytochrome b5-related protein-like [Onthophagus taurus]|uniref:cytochrome b5-related protein-like n=1 Tax=Onthophagus taurus TaxID=166361 RepID=UPI000C200D36|nr:cytochrome b5-related protein-like [Onthophagus taurus]
MPPNNTQELGTIGFKSRIPGFGVKEKSSRVWLNGRKQIDGAENVFWRVHDGLYDLTGFIKNHPGGSQWLELTQGTDITEAFEAHHLSEKPEKLLEKFYIKDAITERVSPYTFKRDGFYRTLKKRVGIILKDTPKIPITISKFYADSLLILTFLTSLLACNFGNYFLVGLSGFFLATVIISAHNYFHQADNFRMFYFQLGFQSVKEWRVSHALSHHLFPNTIIDMEMYIFEPLATYFPKNKSFLKRYLPWLVSPLIWCLVFHGSFFLRLREFFKYNKKEFNISYLIPFSLPIFLVTFSNQPVITCFYFWTCIILSGSFIFAIIGINAAHHAPDIFHDGDAARNEKDFGIAQLDAVMDREEILGSHLWTLTTFGQHALHHLFPTIDHGLLKFIYPVFEETMNEFGVGLRLSNSFKLMKGQFRQIAKVEPNLIPPGFDLIKNK